MPTLTRESIAAAYAQYGLAPGRPPIAFHTPAPPRQAQPVGEPEGAREQPLQTTEAVAEPALLNWTEAVAWLHWHRIASRPRKGYITNIE